MMSKEWVKDTGIILGVLLLIPYISLDKTLLLTSIAVFIISLTIPKIFYPLGWLWFKFSILLRVCVQTVLFSLLFYILVTPMGLLKRLFSKKKAKSVESTFELIDKPVTYEEVTYPF